MRQADKRRTHSRGLVPYGHRYIHMCRPMRCVKCMNLPLLSIHILPSLAAPASKHCNPASQAFAWVLCYGRARPAQAIAGTTRVA
jgi:hypothetical protein